MTEFHSTLLIHIFSFYIGPNDEYTEEYNNMIDQSNNITITCEKISDNKSDVTHESNPNIDSSIKNEDIEKSTSDNVEYQIDDNESLSKPHETTNVFQTELSPSENLIQHSSKSGTVRYHWFILE